MTQVSNMAEHLIGSEIIRLAGEINQRIQQGEHIFNLTIGDFDPKIFPIPEELTAEIKASYDRHETNYPAANGNPELRRQAARFTQLHQGLSYSPDEFLIASGARPLIFALFSTVLDPGDKVLFPVPSWNNNHYTHLCRSEHIQIETLPEDNFMPNAAQIAPHIHEASLVALCSPLNPTGTIFSKEQLSGICELILAENARRGPYQKPLYLMYDQIYSGLVYGENEHHNPVALYPEMRPYTVMVDGMSKTFCATGLRVGWAFGPQHLIDKMKSIVSHMGAWSPKPEQIAVGRYLSQDEAVNRFLGWMHHEMPLRLNGFYQGFQRMKAAGLPVDAIEPQAALYLTVKFDLKGMQTPDGQVITNSRMAYRYLLDAAKVGLVPFYAFGASEDSSWFRLSTGTTALSDVETIVAQLEAAIRQLKPVQQHAASR